MRIALTVNGPGETAGWARPLLRALYELDAQLDAHIFCVPDDYATGHEAALARELFPRATVYDPKTYLRVALGARLSTLPERVDIVQYLGGDLLHALRLHARLHGTATSYRFSSKRNKERFARVFAIDEANVAQLEADGTPAQRIVRVGNLAIDGALMEARNPLDAAIEPGGIVVMPGSRRHEIEQMIPFFFTMALRAARERPGVPIAFALSPFTPLPDVARAVERGGDPRVWAISGRVVERDGVACLSDRDGKHAFPIVRQAMAAAQAARLVVTLPGTKCIELAALGVPTLAITPYNALEKVTFNGALTYLDRIPLVGNALKRSVAAAYARRFRFHTQPNIDADRMLIDELHGTLTPGYVARRALARFDDIAWQGRVRPELAALYSGHVGAARRMAESLLELARSSERS